MDEPYCGFLFFLSTGSVSETLKAYFFAVFSFGNALCLKFLMVIFAFEILYSFAGVYEIYPRELTILASRNSETPRNLKNSEF